MTFLRHLTALLLLCLSSIALAQKVDINSADAATLAAELTGVGPAKAQAIVDHREKNGPFATPEALKDVTGIGDATYEKNKDKITVGNEEEAAE